jgi:hypothetical protein
VQVKNKPHDRGSEHALFLAQWSVLLRTMQNISGGPLRPALQLMHLLVDILTVLPERSLLYFK